jgi:hypothetical protein
VIGRSTQFINITPTKLRNHVAKLTAMGYRVTLQPVA